MNPVSLNNQDLVDQAKIALAVVCPPMAIWLHRGFDRHFWACLGLMLLHISGALVTLFTAMTVQAYCQVPALLYAFGVICKTEATV